jgi:enoyl-CoA hydratase
MPSSVRARTLDGVRFLELDGPESIPRLERSVLEALHAELDAALSDASICGAVITGTDRAFAGGAELAEVAVLGPLGALEFSALGQSLMQKIERSPKPVVAAVRGYCLGGGLDLALACHLRVASSDATFGHPGAGLGIITGWGGTQRLLRLMGAGGSARTKEMLASGCSITAEEAYAWGLVNRIVPPERVIETAVAIVRGATL